MDNSWDTQMEKFEKLHGHLEMVLLLAKIKKKTFLWNLLFHALVNYLKMPQNAPFWMQVKKKFPPIHHVPVATSNFNSACSIQSYWISCQHKSKANNKNSTIYSDCYSISIYYHVILFSSEYNVCIVNTMYWYASLIQCIYC